MKKTRQTSRLRKTLGGLGILAALAFTGCQVQVAGQTMPSPYYMKDDVQYFEPAPREFKLSEEAAKLQAYSAEKALERR